MLILIFDEDNVTTGTGLLSQETSGKRCTVLHIAIQKKNYRLVKLLLENKAKTDLFDNSVDAMAPLHIAVQSSQLDAVKKLMEEELNFTLKNDDGRTFQEEAEYVRENSSTAATIADYINKEMAKK